MIKQILRRIFLIAILLLSCFHEKDQVGSNNKMNFASEIDELIIFYTPIYIIFEFIPSVDSVMAGKDYAIRSNCRIHIKNELKEKVARLMEENSL